MGVIVFDLNTVMPGARSNEDVVRRGGSAGSPASISQIAGRLPNLIRDRQLRERLRIVSKELPVQVAADPCPQFQAHHRAPGRLATPQQLFHTGPDNRIAFPTDLVYPT